MCTAWDPTAHRVGVAAYRVKTTVEDSRAVLTDEVSGFRSVRSNKEHLHRTQWPELWEAIDKLIEAHT